MKGVIRRVAAVVLFLPLGVPFMFIILVTLLWAFVSWVAHGYDEDRMDRILLNGVLAWANDLPLRLFYET
jgi:hypothetical protein